MPRWRRLRLILPWAIAAGILIVVFARIPSDALSAALSRVALWKLAALAVAMGPTMLAADSLALWLAIRGAAPEHAVGYRDVITVRGASYLLALVNYGAGQGGVVYFLRRRHGVPIAAGLGAVLLATGAFLVVVAGLVGVGLWVGAVPDVSGLRGIALLALAAPPIYLLVIAIAPGFLSRRALLRPLFTAGVRATLYVAAARFVHLAALIAGHLAAMRLFGVAVPLATGLIQLPVLFLITALPIAPSGLGTTQAAAITLFAGYAAADTAAGREAAVLAYSLSLHVAGIAVIAAIGLACLARVRGGRTGQTDQ